MLFDRTQSCPMIEGIDTLNPYIDVTESEKRVKMQTDIDSLTTSTNPDEVCYWIIKPE